MYWTSGRGVGNYEEVLPLDPTNQCYAIYARKMTDEDVDCCGGSCHGCDFVVDGVPSQWVALYSDGLELSPEKICKLISTHTGKKIALFIGRPIH